MEPVRPEPGNRLLGLADIILTSSHRQLAPATVHVLSDTVGAMCFSIEIMGSVALRYCNLPILDPHWIRDIFCHGHDH